MFKIIWDEKAYNELNKLEDTETLKQEQEHLTSELSLSSSLRVELEYIRNIVWIKDERKRTVLMMLHNIFAFIEEFSKRTGIDFKTLAYARIDEFEKIMNELRTAFTGMIDDYEFVIAREEKKMTYFPFE